MSGHIKYMPDCRELLKNIDGETRQVGSFGPSVLQCNYKSKSIPLQCIKEPPTLSELKNKDLRDFSF